MGFKVSKSDIFIYAFIYAVGEQTKLLGRNFCHFRSNERDLRVICLPLRAEIRVYVMTEIVLALYWHMTTATNGTNIYLNFLFISMHLNTSGLIYLSDT